LRSIFILSHFITLIVQSFSIQHGVRMHPYHLFYYFSLNEGAIYFRVIFSLWKLNKHKFSQKPSTPYLMLVCTDDHIDIYVDLNLMLSTNSPDDALAFLIAMYTIFELSFDKKNRKIRLFYYVSHGDKRFLLSSTCSLIKEKNIDIYSEQNYKLS
jgi:hypothetical protein